MADVKATVLGDIYRWKTDRDGPIHEANRGDTISVSSDEFERGASMQPPMLAKGTSPDEDAFTDEPVEIPDNVTELSKKELATLAERIGLDASEYTTKDALVGAILGAPGYERPNV